MTIFYPLQKYRYVSVIVLHCALIIISYFLAFFLRLDFHIQYYLPVIYKTILVLLAIKAVIFYYFGLFHSSLRHAGLFDIWQIIKANIIASTLFIIVLVFTYTTKGFPRSVFLLDFGVCTVFICALRIVYRLYKERVERGESYKAKRALIVGAGQAGIMALKEYRSNPHINIKVVGFIDDDPSLKNIRIQGVRVYGDRSLILEVAERLRIDEIIIAIPSATGETIRSLLPFCRIKGVHLKIIPGLHKILNGDLEVRPREVTPDDLLGREQVEVNERQVRCCLDNKRVLVTGGAGSIGSELCRQIAGHSPRQLIIFDYNENDIYFLERELKKTYPSLSLNLVIGDVREVHTLKYVFTHLKPQIVFHAAAFKHVPLMEENPSSAVSNNIFTTRNLIYAAHHYGVERFVFISTDKAVNPSSVMGASKRIGEMLIQSKAKLSRTKFMAVRFGNVLGSKGSVVPLFKRQIDEGGPITITHPDARRYFMSTKEAVQLVLQAASLGGGGEIFVLDMGQQIRIVDLAHNLLTLSGLRPQKDIIVEMIGLRPGEKVFEETLHNIERDQATRHDNIFITHPSDFDSKLLRRKLKELESLVKHMSKEEMVQKINEIISLSATETDAV